jgi:hypothetical protein
MDGNERKISATKTVIAKVALLLTQTEIANMGVLPTTLLPTA